jgi:hypothetical protein
MVFDWEISTIKYGVPGIPRNSGFTHKTEKGAAMDMTNPFN